MALLLLENYVINEMTSFRKTILHCKNIPLSTRKVAICFAFPKFVSIVQLSCTIYALNWVYKDKFMLQNNTETMIILCAHYVYQVGFVRSSFFVTQKLFSRFQ